MIPPLQHKIINDFKIITPEYATNSQASTHKTWRNLISMLNKRIANKAKKQTNRFQTKQKKQTLKQSLTLNIDALRTKQTKTKTQLITMDKAKPTCLIVTTLPGSTTPWGQNIQGRGIVTETINDVTNTSDPTYAQRKKQST